jgi:hypothetical protein
MKLSHRTSRTVSPPTPPARRSLRLAVPVALALGLGVVAIPSASAAAAPVAVLFPYLGHSTTWTVPDGVTALDVTADGGGGGVGANPGGENRGGGAGGSGGEVDAHVTVTPGEVLTIAVGQGGSRGQNGLNGAGGPGGTGGTPGVAAFGGHGGAQDGGSSGGGGGGGGASLVVSGGTVLVTAGGGGGGGGGGGVFAQEVGGGGGTALTAVGSDRVAGNGTDGVGGGHGNGGSGGAAGGPSGESSGSAVFLSGAAGGGGGGGGWPRGGAAGGSGGIGLGGGGGGGAGASGVDPVRSSAVALNVSPLQASGVSADGRVTITYQPPVVLTPTVTTVTVGSPLPALFGQDITLLVRVTSNGQPLPFHSGIVVVQDFQGGDYVCSTLTYIEDDGTGRCVVPLPPDGGHDYYATFLKSDGYASSVGDVTVHVDRATTTTTLTADVDSAVTGQPMTLTATVTRAASSGAGIPPDYRGTVTFRDGGTVLCSDVQLSPATATCALPGGLSLGGHDLTADWTPNTAFGGFDPSSGSLHREIDRAPTSVTLTPPAVAPAALGVPVQFTATVTPAAPATGTPSGAVQFFTDGAPYGSPAPLAGGTATSPPILLGAGTRAVTAQYIGDPSYLPSTSEPVSLDVARGAATVTITSSAPDGAEFGAPVTFTAGLVAVSPATGIPTGTVQFSVDGKPFGSPVPLGDGTASAPIAGLAPGLHVVTAAYSGDGSFVAGEAEPLAQPVRPGVARVTVTSSAAGGAALNAAVTFRATVAPVVPATASLAGTVQFSVDGRAFGGPVSLRAGAATGGPLGGLAPGAHTVTAAYSGDADYQPSSGTVVQRVDVGAQVITGSVSRALQVTKATVVQGATVTGSITVTHGATLALIGATLNGPLRIIGASAVRICGSTIHGPVTISGSAGPVLVGDGVSPVVGCAGNTFWGPVTLSGNAGGVWFAANQVHGPLSVTGGRVGTGIAGNTIAGSLGCSGNSPAPGNGGRPNSVSGSSRGQCAGL